MARYGTLGSISGSFRLPERAAYMLVWVLHHLLDTSVCPSLDKVKIGFITQVQLSVHVLSAYPLIQAPYLQYCVVVMLLIRVFWYQLLL